MKAGVGGTLMAWSFHVSGRQDAMTVGETLIHSVIARSAFLAARPLPWRDAAIQNARLIKALDCRASLAMTKPDKSVFP
jgi:hypothetical protein